MRTPDRGQNQSLLLKQYDGRQGFDKRQFARAARLLLIGTFFAGTLVEPLAAQQRKRVPRLDAADVAAGTYQGDVTNRVTGGPVENVSVTIRKIGPNLIRMESLCPCMPATSFKITSEPSSIYATDDVQTRNNFHIDLTRSPHYLDIFAQGSAWAGVRVSPSPRAGSRR
jgi:hypothetical protein